MTEHLIEFLLVEENPDDVKLTLRAFKSNHLANHTHVVRDGAEALDYLFAEGQYAGRNINDMPRVVLLNLQLPKIDGLEVLRRIKSDPRTQMIPVVMLTSSRAERDLVESHHPDVHSYIIKPVDFEQLTAAVQNLGMYWVLMDEPPADLDSRNNH